jgi:hypothetical protein
MTEDGIYEMWHVLTTVDDAERKTRGTARWNFSARNAVSDPVKKYKQVSSAAHAVYRVT